jgi:hypothetical protein
MNSSPPHNLKKVCIPSVSVANTGLFLALWRLRLDPYSDTKCPLRQPGGIFDSFMESASIDRSNTKNAVNGIVICIVGSQVVLTPVTPLVTFPSAFLPLSAVIKS